MLLENIYYYREGLHNPFFSVSFQLKISHTHTQAAGRKCTGRGGQPKPFGIEEQFGESGADLKREQWERGKFLPIHFLSDIV